MFCNLHSINFKVIAAEFGDKAGLDRDENAFLLRQNELAGPYLRVITSTGNIAPFEEMSQRSSELLATLSDLTEY